MAYFQNFLEGGEGVHSLCVTVINYISDIYMSENCLEEVQLYILYVDILDFTYFLQHLFTFYYYTYLIITIKYKIISFSFDKSLS